MSTAKHQLRATGTGWAIDAYSAATYPNRPPEIRIALRRLNARSPWLPLDCIECPNQTFPLDEIKQFLAALIAAVECVQKPASEPPP